MKDVQETMPMLERFLVLMSDTQAGVKESMMPETFCLFAQMGRTLETSTCIISVHQES